MIDFEFEFQYAETKLPILRQVGGGIPAGRCVVLCGGSGCGKSTLLRCINGLIPQFYEGELKGFCRLNGQDTAGISIGEIGELAASVFQDPRSQFFTVNSSNEVAFGLENLGLPQETIRQRVEEAFRVFHLERLKDRNVYELSSGERQFISILSAWAMDTDIFLLDEPTANLDFVATQQLKEILLALKKQGKTLLLSEHRLYYLADIADEYWVMADGEIKGKYTAAETKAFSVERRQTLSLRMLDLAEITVPEKEPLPKTAPTALAVSDVRYTYGRKAGDTLSGVSFSVREHEIVGLVGANGCGKTTIGKLIAGLYRPSGGRIMLFGKPQNPKQLQKQVLFILQEAEFQFFTGSVLHELQYGHAVTPEFEAKTEALLKSMDLWDCRDRHPFSLSGGQMQRLTLMMAYLSDKPIVILDEPTAGQDAESLERCAALIREMRKEKTVLIITHDLELIADACDYCIGLSDGCAEAEISVQSEHDLQAVRRYMERFHPSDVPAKKQHKERFHPATKLLYWLALLVVISTSNNHLVYAAYAALILLTAADGWLGTALAGGMSFGLLWAANAMLPGTVFSFMLVLFPRIIAVGISMRTLIGRNEASRTLAALRNLHLPERLIMIVAVIFRFFPVLSGDMKLLRQSIRTRGAFTAPLQKLRALPSYLEILTVPMALRVIRIAETLSASAETRGIDLTRPKATICRFGFLRGMLCSVSCWQHRSPPALSCDRRLCDVQPYFIQKGVFTMSTVTANKLKVKDIITVVLLALINVVIFFASSVLYATPITIILMPVFFALLEGIVYFIIGTKVKKPGAILIYSIVRAIMGGYLPYIILFILSGVIAELLWKMGYGNAKALTVSYVINQVLAAFGSTIIPYAIAAKAMADQMVTDGRQDTILAASQMLQSWVSVALVAGVIVAAFIGAMIGKRIVKKHLAA